VGLVELDDAETGKRMLIDTSAPDFQSAFARNARQRQDMLRQLARAARIDLIDLATDGNHLDALTRFFHLRERRLGHL
jgi:hypothetical protein